MLLNGFMINLYDQRLVALRVFFFNLSDEFNVLRLAVSTPHQVCTTKYQK